MTQTARTRTFRSGNSQAVRLPKDVAFEDGIELTIEREGDVVTLRPVRKSMAWLVERMLADPRPGQVQERPSFEAPERSGL